MPNLYTREELINSPEMKEKYDLEYPLYFPEQQAVTQLKSLLSTHKITIVMGTWCSDSLIQVSRFYKIIDETGISEQQVSLICVDETKQAQDGLTDQLNITRVPTFIITSNNKEIGRITESPISTLENDMVQILTKK